MNHSGHNPRRRSRGRQRGSQQRKVNYPQCPLCAKPVRELHSAITHRETGKPAHFACILKDLKKNLNLSDQEKLCYLGSGSFGIIQFRTANSPLRFFIRERIQYEPSDLEPEWREKMIMVPF